MKPHKEKKDRQWSRLDNAAKIFPSTSGKRDTKVFRFACELVRPVEEAILQQALDRTLEEFPGFLCVLKHGLFWYYLEEQAEFDEGYASSMLRDNVGQGGTGVTAFTLEGIHKYLYYIPLSVNDWYICVSRQRL